jgi:hypothetical protein
VLQELNHPVSSKYLTNATVSLDMTELEKTRMDKMLSIMCVQQHLLMALFDNVDHKDYVIKQFTDATEMTCVSTRYSSMSDDFLNEFQIQRDVILFLLNEARGGQAQPVVN